MRCRARTDQARELAQELGLAVDRRGRERILAEQLGDERRDREIAGDQLHPHRHHAAVLFFGPRRADLALHLAERAREDRLDPRARERNEVRGARERLVVDQARDVRAAREVLHRAAERGVERVALVLVAAEVLEHVDQRPHAALEHRGVERFLAGEVVVEARGGEADRGRDVAHRGAREAALGEQGLGGVEDAVARDRRLGQAGSPW